MKNVDADTPDESHYLSETPAEIIDPISFEVGLTASKRPSLSE
jgi:hypothetical protein